MSRVREQSGGPVDPAVRGSWKRPVGLVVLVGLIILAFRFSGAHGWVDLATITAWLDSIAAVWWAPIALVLLFVLFNLVGLPGSVLTLAAGVVWGWLLGGIWALVGSTAGTILPYVLARMHAPFIEERMGPRVAWMHERLRRESFSALLMFRLVPAVPYALINYAAGFAGIPPLHYFLATLVGTIPGVFIYTWLADSIFSGEMSIGGAFGRIAVAGLLLASLVLASRILARRLARAA
ncbi:MAG TPA: VTT domain-containing protein [Thermoanaerobaculia bacterium]|nr:VTT domain-containing protein [Thermoanaerobaculia bacterium]